MSIATVLRMPVPLNHEAHDYAARFAAEQATPAKGKRVYLNTLAVYAVHTYLNWLNIPTDLAQSDCWQPGLRAMFDLADLAVPEIGVLECRPILPGTEAFTLPLEVIEDRIGCVAVQFQEDLNTVELLGFVRAIADEPLEPEIPLNQLLPLDSLLDLLYPEAAIHNLRQWLEGQFGEQWKSIDQLVPMRHRNAARSPINLGDGFSVPAQVDAQVNSVSRAMTIQLAQSSTTVVLVVQVIAIMTAESRLNVSLRLYPDNAARTLPQGLTIAVLDQANSVVLESQSNAETLPELLLNCQAGEQFTMRISLGDYSVTEAFCV